MIVLDEKKVLIMISAPPFRNLNCYEALRASLGLINHIVRIVWTQDGVYNALQATKNTMLQPFIRLAKDMDYELYVFEEDLRKRNLGEKELLKSIKPISQDDLLSKILDSDIVITF